MARVEDDLQFSSSQLSSDFTLLEAAQEVGLSQELRTEFANLAVGILQ